MKLSALIFDVDGTLSETEEVHRRAFNETFVAFGLPWAWDRPLYKRLLKVTGGKERLHHFIAAHAAKGVEGSAPDLIARLHRDKTDRYVALIEAGAAELRPGIVRLFDEAAAAGIKLAIATTTSLPNVVALLEAALGPSAMRRFSSVAAGDIVAKKKPAPDIFQVALRELSLLAAACLAVEDSVNGLRSAQSAGCPVLITTSSYTDDEDFAGALAVVADLDRAARAVPSVDGRVHLDALARMVAAL